MEKDRGDLHDFTVEVARLGAIIEGVRKGQNNQTEKIADAVEEAIEPIVDEAKGLKKIIKDKRFVTIKGKNWLKFWKRG